jgi:hypothetical protein
MGGVGDNPGGVVVIEISGLLDQGCWFSPLNSWGYPREFARPYPEINLGDLLRQGLDKTRGFAGKGMILSV